ncbi:ferrochelatase [Parvibaculum sp. MBR-TMA-1.3b-4.2]|jgi:ferrochelatase
MSDNARRKVAIVLFNLGGPDGPDAVQPFLFNLFNDPAIIRLPNPLRWLIAKIISSRRAPVAREIYANIGGRSPLVPETRAQGDALEKLLTGEAGAEIEAKCFIAMRYWHPFANEAVEEVKTWGADEIVLLPLYPQYSTTTTESSLKDWDHAVAAVGLDLPTRAVCCYPTAEGFIGAYADLLKAKLDTFEDKSSVRILFSAHGLPKKIVDQGDPYQAQVEQSCEALAKALGIEALDWRASYQSRVGPMEWIGPATDDEIEKAGAEGKSLIVVPIAFVSEHSETLVELDIEYGELAKKAGVPRYERVATLSSHPAFIEALAALVRDARTHEGVLCPEDAAGRPCTENVPLKSVS